MDEHAEFHCHALVQAKDGWARTGNKSGNIIRARIGVYGAAMKATAAHDLRIIVRGLDVPAYQMRHEPWCEPHQIVLRHLLEPIDGDAAGHDELALVIADGAEGHQQHFRDYQAGGTGVATRWGRACSRPLEGPSAWPKPAGAPGGAWLLS